MLKINKSIVAASVATATFGAAAVQANEIIHDAEHYILHAQSGERWAVEDKDLDAKLAELEARFGTKPNIIHYMWDDTPLGDVGIPDIQKTRGYETPVFNQMAKDGANFMRMYTEPSCTPTRAAALTGRYAVRNGMYTVGFPYEYGGLPRTEVTIAEVLSNAGYKTAFHGKAHQGDTEGGNMNEQGFDEAFWTPYNQVPSLYNARGQFGPLAKGVLLPEMFPEDPYDLDPEWRPSGFVYALEGNKGGPVTEWGEPTEEYYYNIDREATDRTMDFMQRSVEEGKPFYVAHWPTMASFMNIHPSDQFRTTNGSHLAEGLVRIDEMMGEIQDKVIELGIEENTLIIAMADNGPMVNGGPVGFNETLHTGGKGMFTEGAVRVPMLATWPGMIEEGSTVGDILHVTDLFTTFARLGGALDGVPTDRIIDGVDQTSLFINGDTYSRRDYVYIYTGDELGAIVKGRYKHHVAGAAKGLSGAEYYDLYADPRERVGMMLPMFPAKGMFTSMKTRHNMMIDAFPNIEQERQMPFTSVENPRAEVEQAGKLRVDEETFPIDIREHVKNLKGYENIQEEWKRAQ
ncbi:sulfatase-like hydrolase/transferase [Vibrio agarivorans]|uniref:sulfatase-like hydrolase/transferase n=1 Tax=Vibrio agarivorans TaxID=153622 RepID=UPI0025B61883|nr:sulfatase-like hydrolase/transferase [Vibrio agarivorans]MDN3659750.1 sulfatase-like hydrolase/transferase [Vibrio agarivorans]